MRLLTVAILVVTAIIFAPAWGLSTTPQPPMHVIPQGFPVSWRGDKYFNAPCDSWGNMPAWLGRYTVNSEIVMVTLLFRGDSKLSH